MKIFVTGGAGFLGSYLANELLNEGHEVIIYDSFVDLSLLSLISGDKISKVKVIQGDIQDLPLIMRTIKGNGIKHVAHLAALLTTASHDNPHFAIKVNCLGTANILETGRILGIEKIVWASSVAAGGREEPTRDNPASYKPREIYGACKAFNETLTALYSSEHGLDITGLRFPLIYGEGQRGGVAATLMTELIKKPLAGKPGEVPYGDDIINWLYVRDAARAITHALKTKKPRTLSFNVGGELRPMKDARDLALKHLPGARLTLLPGTMGLSWQYSTKSIESEMGFKPLFTLEDGMGEIIRLVRGKL